MSDAPITSDYLAERLAQGRPAFRDTWHTAQRMRGFVDPQDRERPSAGRMTAVLIVMGLMVTACVFVLMLAGCTTPQPWVKVLTTEKNAQCMELVKHQTCDQFVKVSIRMALAAKEAKDFEPQVAPIADALIQEATNDIVKLRDMPECFESTPELWSQLHPQEAL